MFTDDYFMNIAFQQAQIAYEKDEVPVGCVIVHNNRIIAKAHNLTEQLNDVTAHAEMQAITAAANLLGGKYLIDCSLYVTLEPCVMCGGALTWAQLSRLVIAAEDAQRGFLHKGLALHPKTQIITGIMAEESALLLKNFFKSKR
ncbi:nucleoside deaminase [Elizabethkingia argentiflava]|uniref:tRNA-specific adenosine deaminase n=1 Tax=Elizabethkingia argenteiflava TaxID=2681556 RepID=A0A845PUF5_9FLAO|nr:nucleoside deaminase [Elizabethkingia argenteiflava]NAW50651.1 nucleoside deaminase [Elizabethkingia argenteiflava]